MLDYRPDIPSREYSTLSSCLGFFPYNGGYRTAYGAAASGYDTALTAACIGARAVKNDSGTTRVFFGSAAAIQEADGAGGWTDRSRGGGYTSGSNRWWFSQGISANEVIATNYADEMQSSTGAAFSNLTNAPKAKIVLTQSEALLALNYNDGTSYPNGIKISDRGNSTTWTATGANDATNVILRESPGEIVAGAVIHDLVVAWKKRSMYVGRFVAGDEKWQFNLLSPYVGCSGIEAWCSTPAGIIFFGEAGTYLFDGSVPRPIDRGIKRLMRKQIAAVNSYGKNVAISHDDVNACVFIWMPDAEGAGSDLAFVYNYVEDRWSIAFTDGNALGAGATHTGFEAIVRDYTLVDHASLAGTAPSNLIGHFIVTDQHKLINLAEGNDASTSGMATSMTLGRFGHAEPDGYNTLRAIIPVWEAPIVPVSGVTATVTPYSGPSVSPGEQDETTSVQTVDAKGRFNGMVSGNHFDLTLAASNKHYSVLDFYFDLAKAGKK